MKSCIGICYIFLKKQGVTLESRPEIIYSKKLSIYLIGLYSTNASIAS